MSDDDIINKSGNIPLSIIDKPNKTPISRMFVSISIGGKDGLDVIKHILKNEQNININDKDDYWTYLLHYSIVMREEEIALFLIDKGADINLIDIYECTPLNYAVSRFEFKQFRGRNRENKELKKLTLKLILMGADISYANPVTGFFPYTEALKNDYYFCYNQLQNRIDKIRKDKNNYPKEWEKLEIWLREETINGLYMENMIKASITGDEILTIKSINESIKDRGVGIIHGLDSKGQTLLHYSVNNRMRKVSEKLIKMGVDYLKKSVIGLTIFDICLNYPNKKQGKEMMIFLVDKIKEKASSVIVNYGGKCSDIERQKIIDELLEKENVSNNSPDQVVNKKKQKRKEKKLLEAEEKKLKIEEKLKKEQELEKGLVSLKRKRKGLDKINNTFILSKLRSSFNIIKQCFIDFKEEKKRESLALKHFKKKEKKMKINEKCFFFESELEKDFWEEKKDENFIVTC